MSALAGILKFGSGAAPVNKHDVARLGEALDARGPDGGSDAVSHNITMLYRAFHTNRESRLERQPVVTTEGHMLTWNGRLDNRDDLVVQLRSNLPQASASEIPDLTIVMAAYLAWEKDCFKRLIGDFCLVLWDNRSGVLLAGLPDARVGCRTDLPCTGHIQPWTG